MFLSKALQNTGFPLIPHGVSLSQSAVREVEEVVDASFVEELECASITTPAEASSASRSSGEMAASTGVVGGSSKGRGKAGRSRGGGGCSREGRGVQKGIEGDEDARRYRESMAPLQVLLSVLV